MSLDEANNFLLREFSSEYLERLKRKHYPDALAGRRRKLKQSVTEKKRRRLGVVSSRSSDRPNVVRRLSLDNKNPKLFRPGADNDSSWSPWSGRRGFLTPPPTTQPGDDNSPSSESADANQEEEEEVEVEIEETNSNNLKKEKKSKMFGKRNKNKKKKQSDDETSKQGSNKGIKIKWSIPNEKEQQQEEDTGTNERPKQGRSKQLDDETSKQESNKGIKIKWNIPNEKQEEDTDETPKRERSKSNVSIKWKTLNDKGDEANKDDALPPQEDATAMNETPKQERSKSNVSIKWKTLNDKDDETKKEEDALPPPPKTDDAPETTTTARAKTLDADDSIPPKEDNEGGATENSLADDTSSTPALPSTPNPTTTSKSTTLFPTFQNPLEKNNDILYQGPPDGPRVYAFYAPRGLITPDDGNLMISNWLSAWSEKGYRAAVLTLQHAQKHPDFEQYAQAVDVVLATAQEWRRRKLGKELRDCYFRYLAMEMVGGGMMVDLDMVPVNRASSEDAIAPDTFTLYCNFERRPDPKQDWLMQVENQYGLPCAAHASTAEWKRLSRLLPWVTEQWPEPREWTDAHSLLYLEKFDDVVLVKKEKARSWLTRGYDTCFFRYV